MALRLHPDCSSDE